MEDEQRYVPNAVHVITLRGDGAIADATAFLMPGLFARFGLPEEPDR